MQRLPFFILLLVPSLCAGAQAICAAEQADSAPAATQPTTNPALDDLIAQLGDPDPQLREQASKALWSRGHEAEAALRQAAASDDPEVARRAKAILRDFSYGLYPDAPPDLFALLKQFREGDFAQKRAAVAGLANRGTGGLRILLKLREEEHDPALAQLISAVLGPREHQILVLMLAEGQEAQVEQALRTAATQSAEAAQDYAALLLQQGKLPQKLAELKAQPITPISAPLLVALARAAGDLPTARDAAAKAQNPDLLDCILVEEKDWKTLADQLSANQQRMQVPETLGFLCAYYRLGGDREHFEKTAADLARHADQLPSDEPFCAENLCLNDKVDQAIDLMIRHNDFLTASNLLINRLQFPRALELPKIAQEKEPAEALKIKARSINALQFIGDVEQTRKAMKEISDQNHLQHDFSVWVYLVESAARIAHRNEADEYAVEALKDANHQDPLPQLFAAMRLGDPYYASLWWQFLRRQYPDQSVAEALGRLRQLYERAIVADDLRKLLADAQQYEATLPPALRETWQLAVAHTLAQIEQKELAGKWFSRLAADSSNPHMLMDAADFEADQKNWSAAAADYGKAWERDHTKPAALFLYGWALTQAGHGDQGKGMMKLAHELPMGSAADRHALVEALARHQLKDDIRQELTLILTATAPRSWERNEALRRSAELAMEDKDYLTAADLFDRAFLQNLSNNISFIDPWANVLVPALIHKTRALGLIQAAKIDAAIEQADLALAEAPGDADAVIELVNALDQTSQKKAADDFFQRHTAIYRRLVSEYPRSGPAHNQLAWAQVMCHRELDDALRNALRAVELEPTSTASIDTLAEVYFARGNPADAVKQMQRCVELEPYVPRHRSQLARFQAALHPTTTRAASS